MELRERDRMHKRSPRRLLAALAIPAVALMLLANAGTSSAATTSILRPNADVSSTGSWTVVGAGTASEALDDNVTETQTPSSTDYIGSSGAAGDMTVGLKPMPLAGA